MLWGLEIKVFFWVLNTVCAVELQKITATRRELEWKYRSQVGNCVWLCWNACYTRYSSWGDRGTCYYPKHSLLLIPDSSGNMWMPHFSCLLHCGTGWLFFFPSGIVESLMKSAMSVLMNLVHNAHLRSSTLPSLARFYIICHLVTLSLTAGTSFGLYLGDKFPQDTE